MSQTTKRKRTRKSTKEKDSSSRQTSLWDAFGLKNTPTASAATSENESVGTDDVIEIDSSDAEPLRDPSVGPAPSSPYPTDGGSLATAGEDVLSGSKDVPIFVPDSSPLHSPVRPRKLLPQHPPKPLYSIFAPKRRPDERPTSQKPAPIGSAAPPAPFPDAFTQHIRGPQSVFNTTATAPSQRLFRNRVADTEDAFSYSQLMRGCNDHAAHKPVGLRSTAALPLDAGAKARHLANLPLAHRRFPAINRFYEISSPSVETTDASTASHLLWNDKWRPLRANQILGNERSALYLRDWLLASKLHIARSDEYTADVAVDLKGKRKAEHSVKRKGKGAKRPRIIREVQKKRRQTTSEEREGSWIANDSTDDELPLEAVLESEGELSDFSSFSDFVPTRLSRLQSDETNDYLDEPPSSPPPLSQSTDDPASQPLDLAPPSSYRPAKFGSAVYNTILLSGPHGCGKTAAVYACAEELGWDVFEVYPGIGERSGVALSKLIGDVGKNHLVKSTQHRSQPARDEQREKAIRPKRNIFVKRIVSDDEGEDSPSQRAVSPAQKGEEPGHVKSEVLSVVKQSLILVEEVDVLYKEDANFWPALFRIIKECRRPVVLTCSDTSLIPLRDLPLQTTLVFEPCPTPLAVSYLQALCLAENRLLGRGASEKLYENDFNAAEECRADSALHPDHIVHPSRDLRKAINHLQLGAALEGELPLVSQAPAEIDQHQSIQWLKCIARCTDFVSIVDSDLRRPGKEVLRDFLASSASPSADDLLGFTPLVATPHDMDTDLPVALSTYHWDEAMANELLSFSQNHYLAPAELRDPTPHVHPLLAAHCGTMLPVLDKLRVPREDLVRDASAIFVDYEPWIRHLVQIDDVNVAESVASGLFEGTRLTRNSQLRKRDELRHITLTEEGLAVVRRTGFDMDAPDPEIPPV
ncbi:hypothetical protein BC628DRAFT_1416689 [Trametes gibbosa]|nr:hypothetical protein BC628DRAFT_1416689 [Trametes gibbosa]